MNNALRHAPLLALRYTLCSLIIAATGPVLQAQVAEQAKSTVVVGLSQFDNEITVLRNNLSATMAALAEVKAAAANSGDLTKPYANFSDAVKDLEAQAEKVRQHGVAAKARAKEHWEVWQKELTAMENASLREKAQNRYTATSKQFDKIVERVEIAKKAFAPLMADLKDISVYLKTDLSKEAVSSLSGNIWNMGNTARSVDSKLADVSQQIGRTVKKMPQA